MYPIDFFFRAAQRFPERMALHGPDGRCYSFSELATRVNSLACAMQAQDPYEQSRVGICAGNHAEHVIALLATLAAGKVWVPLNARSTKNEIDRIIQSVTPSILMVDAQGLQLLGSNVAAGACWGIGHCDLPNIELIGEPFLASKPNSITVGREGTQAIKFTGGTTGLPKGVMQPFRAWNACIINQIQGWGLSAKDRYVVCAPVTHGTSTYVLPVLAQGGCLVFPEQNTPASIARAFVQHEGTISFMPPTLIYMLMSDPDVKPEQFSSLRHLVFGGAPMPPEKVDLAISFFGPRVAATYGQTEAPQIVAMIGPRELADPANRGSAGRCSWLSDMAIMSSQGGILPDGDMGEVVVRGDLVMTGYWNMPEKTAETIIDGWLHTGDVGYIDSRGYLFLKDRIRDVVITGGFNVYPVDVEGVLSKHPAVYEACVFGIPHEKWGEAVHAAIQLKPGQTASCNELMQHVRSLLGPVHTPKEIHFVDQLPRSSVGKVLKTNLREQVAKRMG